MLQELTHRSLAFDSENSPGFGGFLKELEAAVGPLASLDIQDDEPFERVLMGLQEAWAQAARQKERAREQAVFALQHAEARNLLAEKIARSIEDHPDAPKVPEVVIDFLCGPWAQVVAQARIKGGAGSHVADKYQALISALLWSAHPDLARQNVTKLTRLVPRLLATLREGLDSIGYPATRTSAFFEALMAIHQLAFRGQADHMPNLRCQHPAERLAKAPWPDCVPDLWKMATRGSHRRRRSPPTLLIFRKFRWHRRLRCLNKMPLRHLWQSISTMHSTNCRWAPGLN